MYYTGKGTLGTQNHLPYIKREMGQETVGMKVQQPIIVIG